MSMISPQSEMKPVGFYCDHSDEPHDARTHHDWEFVEGEGLVFQHRPETTSALVYADRPYLKDADRETRCPRAVPVYAMAAPAPMPVNDQRLADALAAYEGHPDLGFACCTAHAVADHVPVLLAEVQRLKAELADQADADTVANRATQVITSMGAEIRALKQERDRYRTAWQSASERAQARVEGILRITRDRETYQGWLKQEQAATQQLRARVAELEKAATCQSVARINGAHCCLPVRHRGDHRTANKRQYWSDEYATTNPAKEASR